MIVRNSTEEAVYAAAKDVNVNIVNARPAGRGIRFTLGLTGEKQYQRTGFTGRKVNAVCFHGHLEFMRALYRRSPEAKIITSMATYESANDLEYGEGAVADRNVGSMMNPALYHELCTCQF